MLDMISTWNETVRLIKSNELLQDHIKDSIDNTIFYSEHEIILPDLPEKRQKKMPQNVVVTDNDTFTAAALLQHKYEDRIAVLNFANAYKPGGEVKLGAKTQEEDLCRTSTLYFVLDTKDNNERFYKPHKKNKTAYGTSDIIYTPGIVVFRFGSPDYSFRTLDEFTFVDVITCAAPQFKHKLKEMPTNISEHALYKKHIERGKRIIECAIKNGVKILVLGAFGCGDFNNDPMIVATAYRDLMLSYARYFKVVEFAVYCTDKDKKNYNVFNTIIRLS